MPACELPGGAAAGHTVVTAGVDPAAVDRLLRSLPEWFGMESANASYVESARHLPGYQAAWPATAEPGAVPGATPVGVAPVGVLLVKRHTPVAAEIHLMAVDRSYHRRGVGCALVARAGSDLAADGVELLQVKTLGPGHPDQAYASTRLFYQALGFLPLEEIPDLWPGNPCLIMVKPLG